MVKGTFRKAVIDLLRHLRLTEDDWIGWPEDGFWVARAFDVYTFEVFSICAERTGT